MPRPTPTKLSTSTTLNPVGQEMQVIDCCLNETIIHCIKI